ncbi:Het domain protein [Mycena sanguinolenta]|uniref:Het domain protein n=1 Tax=Mycena sanguinolenta TaxID=230812 RepID=A0A8H6ZIF0_9AGAR|nr:Het domain protein [Mycena sanguinolenta]
MPEEKHDASLAPLGPLVDASDTSSSSAPAGTTYSPTNPPPGEEQEIIRDLASDGPGPSSDSQRALPERLTHHFATGKLSGVVSSMHTSTNNHLPPSNIDFALGSVNLGPPYSPTPSRFICSSCVWLGGTREECKAWDDAWQEGVLNDPPGSYYQWRMTFGLLEKLVGHEIPECFLVVRPRDGPAIFSGDNLSALFRDWMYRTEQTEERWDSGWMASMRSALTDILDIINQESHYHQLTQSFKRLRIDKSMAFNITLTVCELTSAVLDILHDFGIRYHLTESDRILLDDLSALPIYMVLGFALNLETRGWCQFDESLIKAHGFTVQAYAYTCDPFNRGGGEAHRTCTMWDCTVNNIDTENYTNKHVSEMCACSHIRPLYEDVAACLSSGQIPVMVPHDAGLVVLPSTNVPYIAISHVWADGLGSHTEKGLPQCQIERLTTMLRSLDVGTATAFWIDGLCIPADRVLRKKAIGLMAQTYYDATAVLVLDAGILACSSYAPLEEQLLRVVTSGWMQRLWTFQEALLARKLFFAFSDEFVNADDLCTTVSGEGNIHGHLPHPLLTPLDKDIYNLGLVRRMRCKNPDVGRPSIDKPAPSLLMVAEVSRSLIWRSTSKPEDKTLAIAGLLGADAKELVDIDNADERMKALLLRAIRLPPDIIFYSLKKLDASGFKWAPRSLMSRNGDTMNVGDDTATCSPTGLLANYVVV